MKELIQSFWKCIDEADFDGLRALMAPDAAVYLPNTREVIDGCENYITFNKRYPGRWRAAVERLHVCGSTAVSCVKVTEQSGETSLYVTSFFEIQNGKIIKIHEYWGENGDPPQWRQEDTLTQRY